METWEFSTLGVREMWISGQIFILFFKLFIQDGTETTAYGTPESANTPQYQHEGRESVALDVCFYQPLVIAYYYLYLASHLKNFTDRFQLQKITI